MVSDLNYCSTRLSRLNFIFEVAGCDGFLVHSDVDSQPIIRVSKDFKGSCLSGGQVVNSPCLITTQSGTPMADRWGDRAQVSARKESEVVVCQKHTTKENIRELYKEQFRSRVASIVPSASFGT